MVPAVEAAELCVAVPVALCVLAPVGCLAGALLLGGLVMAPVACVLAPLLCCTACTLCCCAPNAGDESGPGLYVDRHPVFFAPYGMPYGVAPYGGAAMFGVDEDEVYIVNSTVFSAAPAAPAPQRRPGAVVIEELPPEAAPADAPSKDKAA